MRRAALLLMSLFLCAVAVRAHARAPDTFEEDYHEPITVESPQWLSFELKLGPYRPGNERVHEQFFGDDNGWMLNVELGITLLHIPYVGQLNAAGNWGWTTFKGDAFIAPGETNRSDEESKLVLYPLSALAVLRIDALARQTVIPLTFAGKIGYEWVRWKSETGEQSDGSGFNKGLRWAAQAAFELDIFNRDSARRLDEDFGVNHTYLLFEYYDSNTKGTGDATYQFGLGLQF